MHIPLPVDVFGGTQSINAVVGQRTPLCQETHPRRVGSRSCCHSPLVLVKEEDRDVLSNVGLEDRRSDTENLVNAGSSWNRALGCAASCGMRTHPRCSTTRNPSFGN